MKLKVYLLFAILIVFAVPVCKAQYVALGVRGGVNSRNFTNGEGISKFLAGDTRLNTGPTGAIFLEFKYSKMFSLQPMLELSSQGTKSGVFSTGYPSNYYNFRKSAELNYLMLPVLAKFGVNLTPRSRYRIYTSVGPYVSLLTSARQYYTATQYFNYDGVNYYKSQTYAADIRPDLHRVNGGIEGNVGLMYTVANTSLFVEGGGNYGLFNVQKRGEYRNTGAATIAIGISYWFQQLDYRRADHFMSL
ncbi:PorT family protein [Mucilaginibacter sp. RS28]|uniref:PorT family protein n=1 Tax=Mucilaginibacter straminoryzae TaxID=2932774 RepID=A0A9X2B9T7_9SPHI|nr:PorT family protein [Mucilaginibacter straminoryzae]MCJ8211019.1 PorT family protein [Mucilaginibacter straminoryzae]